MLSDQLRGLFADGIAVVELAGEGDAAELLPAEAQYLGRSVEKRVREYAAGRQCARRALAEFGIPAFPIEVGEKRRPIWPRDMVGSITHTEGFAAAAVGRRDAWRSIGIDCELMRVKPELWRSICREPEITWLNGLPEGERVAAATLIFSAKEAFYKCQSPLTDEFLGFEQAQVEVQGWGSGAGSFTITAASDMSLCRLVAPPWSGRYRFHQDFVTAALSFAQP